MALLLVALGGILLVSFPNTTVAADLKAQITTQSGGVSITLEAEGGVYYTYAVLWENPKPPRKEFSPRAKWHVNASPGQHIINVGQGDNWVHFRASASAEYTYWRGQSGHFASRSPAEVKIRVDFEPPSLQEFQRGGLRELSVVVRARYSAEPGAHEIEIEQRVRLDEMLRPSTPATPKTGDGA